MSIRPTEMKETIYEAANSEMKDREIKKIIVKKKYFFILLFTSIDYAITICNILYESNIFYSEKENNYLFLIINASCFTAFFLFIIISLLCYNVCLSKIVKYLYIILLSVYFVYLLVLKIIYFIDKFDDVEFLDVIFLILLLITIIPKIFFFCYIDGYIVALVEKNECQRGEEHEDFRQYLENKMERGDNTNWSKTSMPNNFQRASS